MLSPRPYFTVSIMVHFPSPYGRLTSRYPYFSTVTSTTELS